MTVANLLNIVSVTASEVTGATKMGGHHENSLYPSIGIACGRRDRCCHS